MTLTLLCNFALFSMDLKLISHFITYNFNHNDAANPR